MKRLQGCWDSKRQRVQKLCLKLRHSSKMSKRNEWPPIHITTVSHLICFSGNNQWLPWCFSLKKAEQEHKLLETKVQTELQRRLVANRQRIMVQLKEKHLLMLEILPASKSCRHRNETSNRTCTCRHEDASSRRCRHRNWEKYFSWKLSHEHHKFHHHWYIQIPLCCS